MSNDTATLTYDQQRELEHKRNAEIRLKLLATLKVLKMKDVSNKELDAYDCRVSGKNDQGEEIYIHFSAGYGNKRLNVSGTYPRTAKGEYIGSVWENYEATRQDGTKYRASREMPSPSITISTEKTPEQIAKDITNRFMPDYRKRLAKVLEYKHNSDDYEATTIDTLTQIKGKKLDAYETDRKELSIYNGMETINYTINASRKECTLKIDNLSAEQVKGVIALLKKG